jgi:hypothetical protein
MKYEKLTPEEEKLLKEMLQLAWEEVADDVVRYDKSKSQRHQRAVMEQTAADQIQHFPMHSPNRGVTKELVEKFYWKIPRKDHNKILKETNLHW